MMYIKRFIQNKYKRYGRKLLYLWLLWIIFKWGMILGLGGWWFGYW